MSLHNMALFKTPQSTLTRIIPRIFVDTNF